MKKTVYLSNDVIDDNGNKVAEMIVKLEGDGATPIIQTTGRSNIKGFNDDGSPIIEKVNDKLLENAHQEFMAKAIKEQKKLCVENGINPDLVNITGAEESMNE